MMVKKILVVLVVAVIAASGYFYLRQHRPNLQLGFGNEANSGEQANPVSGDGSWLTYTNDEEKIQMDIPKGWKTADAQNTNGMDLWVVFTPEDQTSVIKQISLSVKKETEGELASETEFEKIRSMSDYMKIEGNQVKLVNNNVANTIPAVTLSNMGTDTDGNDYWLYLSWWRKDGKNYYLDTYGYGERNDLEIQLHLNILDRIKML